MVSCPDVTISSVSHAGQDLSPHLISGVQLWSPFRLPGWVIDPVNLLTVCLPVHVGGGLIRLQPEGRPGTAPSPVPSGGASLSAPSSGFLPFSSLWTPFWVRRGRRAERRPQASLCPWLPASSSDDKSPDSFAGPSAVGSFISLVGAPCGRFTPAACEEALPGVYPRFLGCAASWAM